MPVYFNETLSRLQLSEAYFCGVPGPWHLSLMIELSFENSNIYILVNQVGSFLHSADIFEHLLHGKLSASHRDYEDA